MAQNCIWIFSLPLIAFLIQVSIGKRLPRQGDWVSTGAIFGSFLLAAPIFFSMLSNGGVLEGIKTTWMALPIPVPPEFLAAHPNLSHPTFNIDVGILVNNLTAIMLFMVTLCSTLIHLFSTGYMHGEPRYHLFFAYISLFSAGMLGLVVSDNLLTFFICWEIMGLCSYLLIGFYYQKPSATQASLKAFMTTRIGDVGLFLGMMGIYSIFGTSNFEQIYAGVASGVLNERVILGMPAATFIGLMVLMGAAGKSAQFPLHVWLPDAMEGPTPVSALIHAATMVAAGVFLLVRMFPLLFLSETVMISIAAIGTITALMAALIALVQTDIKKVLAYSTISQLGYMVMGIGCGAFAAAFLHCITHAFFKACLFLGSGSVIHSVHTQDMREMGALRSKMPITFVTMLVATLAISGLPFFSGFVSKDRILAGALGHGMEHHLMIIPIVGFITAGLTAFYMFRLIYMTFFGPAKDEHKHHHAHEQPLPMTIPLMVLAVLSLSIWFAGPTGLHSVDHATLSVHWFDDMVAQTMEQMKISIPHNEEIAHTAHHLALVLSLILAAGGILFSTAVYLKQLISAQAWQQRLNPLYKVLTHKFYFDELYIGFFIQKVVLGWNNFLAKFDDRFVDRVLVDGWRDVSFACKNFIGKFDDIVIDRILVDGTGTLSSTGGWFLRRFQTGNVQQYLILTFILFAMAFIYLTA